MDFESKNAIAKFLSNQSVCSRKEAEKLVYLGKVKVNGETLKSLN